MLYFLFLAVFLPAAVATLAAYVAIRKYSKSLKMNNIG